MQYVVNFTSMQYMSISVDISTEGTLSTIVAYSVKPGLRLKSLSAPQELNF